MALPDHLPRGVVTITTKTIPNTVDESGRNDDCATCSCDCHDNPRPAGTYLTIRLDADSASIRPAHVTIQEKP